MEQSLIDKYLAGENTPKEAQQLKLLLEANQVKHVRQRNRLCC